MNEKVETAVINPIKDIDEKRKELLEQLQKAKRPRQIRKIINQLKALTDNSVDRYETPEGR